MSDPTHQPEVTRPQGRSPLVLVCEHASNAFPAPWGDLGLPPEAQSAHIAWDPGALAVALHLSDRLAAALVAGTVSRLVYDCNRPLEAPDAMPARADTWDVPGNAALDVPAREARAAAIHDPFHAAVAQQLAARPAPVLVTVHSFTPVMGGTPRPTEFGILHDTDTRLADAMLARAPKGRETRRNMPYGPGDGVTYTLRRHALPSGHLNVMLEIRNDLIADAPAQTAIAALLADWLTAALEDATCSA
ncbi:N-formylglutamate amidohydrolase [Jannaschia sp.]|nr:N-formylglutamate amidohydrolase [Jannaschia sp.]